jgi:cytochrome P450
LQTTPSERTSTSAPSPRARGGAAPPGDYELPFVGSSVALARDPLGFLERISRRHGDALQFGAFGQRVYLFNHPDAIEQMLVGARDHLIKDKLTRDLSLLLGNGLLVSQGAFWRQQRRLAQPAFHRSRVEAYGEVMVRYAEQAVAGWRDGETRDVHRDMMRLTLDVVAKTIFDVEIGAVARQIERALEIVLHRFEGANSFLPIGVPTPGNRRTRRAVAELDAIVYELIRQRRESGDRGDLLSMLLTASADDGRTANDVSIRDEALTLLLAGHETTALTLTFAWHLLGAHPAALERLEAEIDDVLGERPAGPGDLPKLRYAEGVVRESMRLYPPAWAIGREATSPCEIGGYEIAPGTQLWASQWVVHRDARWFPEPLAFRPERWANDWAKTLPRHAYFPFGGGPRVCIGNAFAMMEAVLLLVTIARRFRLTSADRRPLGLTPSVTLRPTRAVSMVCSARPGAGRVEA